MNGDFRRKNEPLTSVHIIEVVSVLLESRGFVLLFVVSILALFLILAMTFNFIIQSSVQEQGVVTSRVRSHLLATSGIECASARILHGSQVHVDPMEDWRYRDARRVSKVIVGGTRKNGLIKLVREHPETVNWLNIY